MIRPPPCVFLFPMEMIFSLLFTESVMHGALEYQELVVVPNSDGFYKSKSLIQMSILAFGYLPEGAHCFFSDLIYGFLLPETPADMYCQTQ